MKNPEHVEGNRDMLIDYGMKENSRIRHSDVYTIIPWIPKHILSYSR